MGPVRRPKNVPTLSSPMTEPIPTTEDVKPTEVPVLAPVLVDDEPDEIVRKANDDHDEALREAAVSAEYAWPMWDAKTGQWQETRLHPLSLDRWTAWHGMALHHIPIPAGADLTEHIDAKLPSAWSLLYLMAHSREHLLSLLPNPQLYWFAVHEWAEIHCPGEYFHKALNFMITVRDATTLTIATPRPTGKARPRGNVRAPSRGR